MNQGPGAVPADLVLKGAEALGEAGREWRRVLPATVAGLIDKWSLTVAGPFPGLSMNYVAPAVLQDGTAAVLKVWSPRQEGFLAEVETLRLYDGDGAVRLYEVDLAQRALLLERAEPGRDLWTVEREEAQVEIIASLMRRLWRPPPATCSLPTAISEFERMARLAPALGANRFPLHWVATATDIFAELEAAGPGVVLHEDLHQANVLAAQREVWLAIDPHGLIGPPVLDTSQLILNFAWPETDRARRRRKIAGCIDMLAAALDLDGEQIRLCGLARSVLEAFWTLDEKGAGWEQDIALVEDFAAVAR